VTAYDLLVSCPSDIQQFVPLLEATIWDFSRHWGRNNDVVVRMMHWQSDSFSHFGGHPQELLNDQIVDSCDLAVAVFWTRFGTATQEYGSGTEEEIEQILGSRRQLFPYFMDKPLAPSQIDSDEYKRVMAFRSKHKDNGIYGTVADEQELANTFRQQLEMYFQSEIAGPAIKKQSGGKAVLWVDDHPENNVFVREVLERYGVSFSLALNTQQALGLIQHSQYSLIISDMGRKEGPREGYVLLDRIRATDPHTPFLIYAASRQPEHIAETLKHGGQGTTNLADELVDLVIRHLLNPGGHHQKPNWPA
jgi:CheY-like chemotaxis protein